MDGVAKTEVRATEFLPRKGLARLSPNQKSNRILNTKGAEDQSEDAEN